MRSLVKKDAVGRRLVETGEIVPMMVQKLGEGLHQCIKENEHRREVYWIIYTADWYMNGEQLRDTFGARDKCPPRMLNSICWRVDNKIGECREEWVLPVDAPTEDFGFAPIDPNLVKSSYGMPILY